MTQTQTGWKRLLGGAALVALAAVAIWAAWPSGRHPELGPSFHLDLGTLKKVDPARLVGLEDAPISTTMEDARALAVDSAGRLCVGGERFISVLAPEGVPLAMWEVEKPVTCLAAGSNGDLFVGHADRVVVRAADGSVRAELIPPGSNAVLTSVGLAGEEVYVADAGQRRVWRFGQDGSLRGSIGDRYPAEGGGGFVIPSPYFDLAIGPKGALWVVDPGRHALIHFSPEGEVVASWQREGTGIEGFSGCCNPSHIAIRADGSFVTSEKGLVRIKLYDAAGELKGVLAGPDCFKEDQPPLDLAVDAQGRILALEPSFISVFRVEGP